MASEVGNTLPVSKSYMDSIDERLGNLEKNWFNKFGYIPLGVSAVSGKVRITYGIAMIVTAIALAAMKGLKGTVVGSDENEMTGLEFLKKYSFHGLTNIGRGVVEIIVPTASLTGGFYLFAYDRMPVSVRKVERNETPDFTLSLPIPFLKNGIPLKATWGARVAYEGEEFSGKRINSYVATKLEETTAPLLQKIGLSSKAL